MKSLFTSSSRPLGKVALLMLAFLGVGELMLRFDEAFMPFGENRTITLIPRLGDTPELESVKAGTFYPKPGDLRVMVLGDSYMHGGGISFDENISHRLKERLLVENTRFEEIHVLDVTRSNNNVLDNQDTYRKYVDEFQPQVVVLGYTNSDIEGELNPKEPGEVGIKTVIPAEPRGSVEDTVIRKVYQAIYHAKVVEHILMTVHREMKQVGIVVPGSRFDAILKTYSENRPAWVRTQEILTEMVEDCDRRGAMFVLLKFPEMNLLEARRVFKPYDQALEKFANDHPTVVYIDGNTIFEGEKSEDFILHKYDGHPNARAHQRFADTVFQAIDSRTPVSSRP